MSSCDEDVMDLVPKDAISEVTVFDDESLIEAYVKSSYKHINHLWKKTNRCGTESMTDMAMGANGNYIRGRVDPTNGEGITEDLWKNAYKGIRAANAFMEKIQPENFDGDRVANAIGRIKFLRAWLYFDLVRNYGGVPIITQTFTIGNFEGIKRNSSDEVFDFIIKECEEAFDLLPENGTKSMGNKAAALALKAKALLYHASPLFNPSNDMQRWEKAATANKVVMNLPISMHPNYREIFKENIVSEVLFCVEYNVDINQGGWRGANVCLWGNGYYGWSQCRPSGNLVNLYQVTNGEYVFLADGTFNPAANIDPHFPYDNRDPRLSDNILYNGLQFKGRDCQYWYTYPTDGTGLPEGRQRITGGEDTFKGSIATWNASKTGYNFRKLTDETKGVFANGNKGAAYTPDIKMRKTEFYLNYAETQIILGNDSEARDAINLVRARQSVSMPAIPNLSGADLMKEYRNERSREFVLENQRWYDIRRWKIGTEVFKIHKVGVWIEKTSDGTIWYNYNNMQGSANDYNFKESHYLMPIPQKEIEASDFSLDQNPGYN